MGRLWGLQQVLQLNICHLCPFNTSLRPIQALFEIVLLTGAVGATMVSWYSISRTATLLMAPYLSWLFLATSLNYCIWRDNPEEKEEQETVLCALKKNKKPQILQYWLVKDRSIGAHILTKVGKLFLKNHDEVIEKQCWRSLSSRLVCLQSSAAPEVAAHQATAGVLRVSSMLDCKTTCL